MLLELHITGLGVIDEAGLELSPGLNVLTGETGAGKTMVTVGLALVIGQRAQSSLVRPGSDRASVEARFDARSVPGTEEWAENGELVLSRAMGRDGRSSARAGGQMVPVSTLAELGSLVVEVHGQHQTQRLLSPASHVAFLDRFAGPSHVETLGRYRTTFGALRDARDRLSRLDEDAREREREKDLLAYQVGEIEASGLRPGEVAELEAEESRLAHAERILERLSEARDALGDEGGGADRAWRAARALADAAGADRAAAPLASRLASLAEEARDAAEAVRRYRDSLALDPERLEAVRERLAAIKGLERKYGEGEEGVLAYLEQARARLAELERTGDERDALVSEVGRMEEEARGLAARLTAARAEAAPRLAAALQDELRDLGMEGARVELTLTAGEDLGPDGAETGELLFSAGAGQSVLPLARVASGGELSRTMLACRTVLADLDDVPTLVFDEVDQGIGGRAGVAVGRRLARLARQRQVLVVTHLPQIACFADRHFRVEKESGRTSVDLLDDRQRVEELSRMLSGMPTEEAGVHAEQLLAEASRAKAEAAG